MSNMVLQNSYFTTKCIRCFGFKFVIQKQKRVAFKPRLCSTVLGIKHAHTRQRSGPLLWKSWFSKDLPPSPEIQYYFPGEDRSVTTKYEKYYKVAVCRLYAFVFLEQTEIQSNTYFVVKQLVCSSMSLRNYCIS